MKQKAILLGASLVFVSSLAFNLWQFFQLRSFKSPPASIGASIVKVPDLSLQNEALCNIAKDQLKDHWVAQKENVLKAIQVVNHPDEMKRKLELDIQELSSTLKLSPEQKESFTATYIQTYNDYVSRFRQNLNSNPPNWKNMFQALKEFYSAQDELVKSNFGPQMLVEYRKSQVQKRTPMLAILSTYAEIPWDKNIIW